MENDQLDACRQLMAVDSTPRIGTHESVLFVRSLAQRLGLHADVYRDPDFPENASIIVTATGVRATDCDGVLVSHLDTNEPGLFSHWTQTDFNPFNATVSGGMLYGLGALTGKADFISKLTALATMRNKAPKWAVVGTYGDELDMQGMSYLLKSKKMSPRLAVVGSHSSLKLVEATARVIQVQVHLPFSDEEKNMLAAHREEENTSTQSRIFKGRRSPSFRELQKDNAINKMLAYLEQLPRGVMIVHVDGGINSALTAPEAILELDITRFPENSASERLLNLFAESKRIETDFVKHRFEGFLPETPQLNIGRIWTTEDGIGIGISLKAPSQLPREVIGDWWDRIKRAIRGVKGKMLLEGNKAPYELDETQMFAKTILKSLNEVGLPSQKIKKLESSCAPVLRANGAECVIIGPGEASDDGIGPNESVSLDQLDKAFQLYQKIIRG